MVWMMFFVGIVIGAVLGFGFGVVMMIPLLNQVSDLEDMLMRSRTDLHQMKDRVKILEMIGE